MDEEDSGQARRRAEAGQWFARLKTLPVSQATLRDFFDWRRRDGNAEAFVEAEKIWADAQGLESRPAILRAVETASRRASSQRRFAVPSRTVLAGIVTVVLVSGAIAFYANQARQQVFRTAAGQRSTVALADGSQINLNTQTNVEVRFSRQTRSLVLKDGEALFHVARDKSRPFTVAAGPVLVTATGTRFDVSRNADQVVVTLIEGQVHVSAPDGSIDRLQPGDRWQWPFGRPRVKRVNTAAVGAWTQGRIVFDGSSLADAIAQVNRFSGKEIVLDAPRFGSEEISGSFEAGDADAFVTAVTAYLPIKRQIDDKGRIHLVAANP